MSGGQGATNSNVYSDMIAQDLLRRGYYASALGEVVSEGSEPATFQRLQGRGMNVVLAGSMNMSSTTSVFAGLTGGDYENTGVTAFTVKALDASSGRVLFIMSAQYGTSKKLSRVIGDLGTTLASALTGRSAAPAAVAPVDVAPPVAVLPAPVASVNPVNPPPVPSTPARPMLSLIEAQRRLNRLGYACGSPDGRLGARTRQCLEAFQERLSLPTTGALDQSTSDALRTQQ